MMQLTVRWKILLIGIGIIALAVLFGYYRFDGPDSSALQTGLLLLTVGWLYTLGERMSRLEQRCSDCFRASKR